MNENYLVIGTAGHVDHGKSQLIQALTGIPTDRLKEERERGISIELGFAYLQLPDGRKAGIVDVPGHEKFVRQMLAGATGMDVVLLVIAADEGFMPQTQEHLEILNILRIESGIIVITKTDLVEEEWLNLIELEIKEKLKNSFLENAPICKVSSVSGEGISELKQTILNIVNHAAVQKKDLLPRMPIDRVFSIQGFGTVVTGTLHGGIVYKGQDVVVEPGGHRAKVRNIQSHGEQVLQVVAGQRAAINLSSLSVADVERGTTLTIPDVFHVGQIIDVELTNSAREQRAVQHRQRIHFHLGTAEILGRVHLLEGEELLPGETCYAQILLEKPVLAAHGDRFVIRYYSPVTTIGGGTVLGIAALKRKRLRESVLEELRIKAKGSVEDLIKKELTAPMNLKEIAKAVTIEERETQEVLNKLIRQSIVIDRVADGVSYYWLKEALEKWGKRAASEVTGFQKQFPLRVGLGREELKKRLDMNIPLKKWQLVLEWGEKLGYYQMNGNYVISYSDNAFPLELKKQMDCLLKTWTKKGLNPPEIKEFEAECKITPEKFEEFCTYFTAKNFWIKIGDYHFSIEAYDKAKSQLKEFLEEKGQITVSEARDLWQTSRKYTVPLLEHFDTVRFTKREDLIRTLY
jgi:selenocysteine-specific elongation factor